MRVPIAASAQRTSICLLVAVLLAAWPSGAALAAVAARDVTVGRGISTRATMTFGSSWVDHDSDGDVDLFLNRHWMRPWFYKARDAQYRLANEDFVSLPGYSPTTPGMVDRHHCLWGEANGDAKADLYCTVGAQSGEGTGPNQLALRTPRGWVDRAAALGIADRSGRGRSVNWLDYDSDGDLDLFLANGLRRGHPNKLFRNDRGTFSRVAAGVDDELRSVSSTWADWDGDRDVDLLVTRGGITGSRPTTPVAYENRGRRFVRSELAGVTTHSWTSASWADHDDDGLVDLALVRPGRLRILRNQRGRFAPVLDKPLSFGRSVTWLDWDNDRDLDLFVVQGGTGRPGSRTNKADLLLINDATTFRTVVKRPLRGPRGGNGEAAAAADFDRDGRIDLFVTNGNNPSEWRGRSTLLRNTSSAGRAAGLDLYGGRWNPLAIGATLEVTTDAGSYWRFVTDGAGYKSQSEVGYAHLGLGDAGAAVVAIRWSDGRRDCVTALAGRIRRVAKGSSPCP